MHELEPALSLGEQHELAVAAVRLTVQDLTALEDFNGNAARTMKNRVALIPEMYSEGAVLVTPLVQKAPDVFFKDERQQVTGAFKPRGAFVSCWTALERDPDVRHLAACSAGNHAQGVGNFVNWHNKNYGTGLTAHAFMAQNASPAKKDALRAQEVVIHDYNIPSLEAARTAAQLFVETSASPAAEVLPYAAPETIAGQGTIMTEIVMQLWESGVNTQNRPLVVRVGWGGGGLALGVAEVMKQLIDKGYVHPDSKVIAVEEANNDSGSRGVARYSAGKTDMTDLFAPGEFDPDNDGTAVQLADIANVALAHKYCQEGLLVFDTAQKHDVGRAMVENPGTEPAGALSIASQQCRPGSLFVDCEQPIEVCVVSGGNLTPDKFKAYRDAYKNVMDNQPNALGGYTLRQAVKVEQHAYQPPEDVLDEYRKQLEDWGVVLLRGSVQRPPTA